MEADESNAPIQSTLDFRFCIVVREESSCAALGKHHQPTPNRHRVRPPQKYHPDRHPIVSTNMPPTTRLDEKPNSWLNPRQAKDKLRVRPSGCTLVTRATELDRCNAVAMPCKALKTISSSPFLTSPQVSRKMQFNMHPKRLTDRGPKTSAIAPERRRVDAVVRPWTEEGKKASDGGRSRSSVNRGSPMTTRPLDALLVMFIPHR
jgi:hypothetical protein